MDKKPYISQSQPIGELRTSGIDCDDCAAELPQNINQIEFHTVKAANDTTKVRNISLIISIVLYFFLYLLQTNSKMQHSQSDLLKMLSYMEGELQARDVVIAALKVFFIHVHYFTENIYYKLEFLSINA